MISPPQPSALSGGAPQQSGNFGSGIINWARPHEAIEPSSSDKNPMLAMARTVLRALTVFRTVVPIK
eukprot:CAMPEP_0183555518 /NCGR_PEP_ID=MMETSP0371-20130417/79648_1 /TAXON_ID=268820 /ORGANISM="Peridinium aciculiferum, Strain PAER-2" /LENGTH=66 /DNA_ID=CAMNT_0025761737 /DNA_START=396 /DNA_END=593 /DNA_ORIENTATION=+